jgi:hypothetical protein
VARAAAAGEALADVPFPVVARAATGHRVLPVNPDDPADRLLLDRVGTALDRVLAELNRPEHPAHRQRRINEVSRCFEDALRAALDADPALACAPPRTAAGRVQRSGYPDLRLVERATGRVTYLDPKLFASRNRRSSLRTFYFQPGRATNKILEDARHLVVGIEHGGKQNGHWRFLRWELVDAARLKVRLKVEFQASNRDLYRPETVLRRSAAADAGPRP